MINSIRRRLLAFLLIAVLLVLTLVIFGNYFLDKRDIESHMDLFLSQSGLAFQALVSDNIDLKNANKIQQRLNTIPASSRIYYTKEKISFNEKFQFQIWNFNNTKLLIHSVNAPLQPLSDGAPGFSWKKIDGDNWRVFTSVNPENHVIFNIAERYETRAELGNLIAADDFYIALLAFPLLALFIWVVISRNLKPLQAISAEVASRVPGYLEPLKVKDAPQEIKPLVDEVNQLLLRLKRALDREKRFAADAAHELKTPLAALKAQVQLIVATSHDDDMTDQCQRLLRIVDRSSHMIEQLLTLSRIIPEEAESFNDFAEIDIHKMATETLALLVPAAVEKSIDIGLDCPDGPMKLTANAAMIGIMLRNLVDNALRYSPEHSFVTVSLNKTTNHMVLSVIDNGPGIPPELRARVFERFYRVLGTNTQGTGLGLAIVQQIASLHQAHVSLGAGPDGSGLKVTVTFPLKPQIIKR